MKLFPRGEFEQAVKKHGAERHAWGFTSWGQFMAMLFCQLGWAHSWREICGGLACGEGQLKHLGVPAAPKKSTLAYANEHRPWQLYQTVFEQTLGKCQALVANVTPSRRKPCPDALLLSVLAQPDADARVVDALPWLVRQYASQMDFLWLVRQAKLQDLQNRLGFVLQVAGPQGDG